MTGPQDPAAASGGRLRAGHADREQVIEALKDAFADGRLTKDELEARTGQTLAARTRADLAALTAGVPPAPAAAGARPAYELAPARRPLARAAVGSGSCLIITAAAVRAAFLADPGPGRTAAVPIPPGLCFLVAIYAAIAALLFLGYGVATSRKRRRSPQPC